MFLVTINGHRISVAKVRVTDRKGDTSLVTLEGEARTDNGKILAPWDKAVGLAAGAALFVHIEGCGHRWVGTLDFKESWFDLHNDAHPSLGYTGKAGLVLQGDVAESVEA
jgi:hypothetical protein